MKRTISALAMLAVFAAAPVMAQTSSDTTSNQGSYGSSGTSGTSGSSDVGTTGTMNAAPDQTDANTTTSDANGTMDDTRTLPATAGPLPLLAAIGTAALGLGVWMSRRRRSH